MEITERARPLAESELTNSLLKLCEKAVKINKLKSKSKDGICLRG